jgi:hypothetical protein
VKTKTPIRGSTIEAEAGIQARRILHDPTFRPVFWEPINLPAHLLYLFAFSFPDAF